MASSQKTSVDQPTRRFVLADNFRPRSNHEVERTESSFGAPTPSVRSVNRDQAKGADPELQDSIKAALAAFGS